MANDFKRMWTKAELEQLSPKAVVDLPDIPETADVNSPDIIRVQGKLYYKYFKEGSIGLTETKWYFNENYDAPSFDVLTFNINFKSNNNIYSLIKFGYSGGLDIYYNTSNVYTPWGGWVNQAYRTIEITGGTDVENADLINWLETNATLLESAKAQYIYKEFGADEELVKSIPTDVNIVKDQGSWQIQLEHDTNVLSVTDISSFVSEMVVVETVEVQLDVANRDFSTMITAFENGVTAPRGENIFVKYVFKGIDGMSKSLLLSPCNALSGETLNSNRWYLSYVDMSTNELKQIIFGTNYVPGTGVVFTILNTYTIGTLTQ